MKIGINVIPLVPGKAGGMEVYVRNLLSHLFMIDKKNTYCLFTAEWNNDSFDYPTDQCEKFLIPMGIGSPKASNKASKPSPASAALYRVLRMISSVTWVVAPSMTMKLKARMTSGFKEFAQSLSLDLLFCPLVTLEPKGLNIPTVITIPDIQHEYYPDFFTREEYEYRDKVWRSSCEEATRVMTISEFARDGIIEKWGLKPEKITYAHLAVDDDILSGNLSATEEVKRKYSLPEIYAYYPANTWHHKNHAALLEALKIFKDKYDEELKVVLTGADFDAASTVKGLIKSLDLEGDVLSLGYVKKEELRGFYEGASLLVFPSLFEGFGIPLLEAMSVGTPVAASNVTSIPEVVDDAAQLFDPTKPDDIADAMHAVLTDENLRSSLIRKGKKRVREFSWDRCARETLDIFDKASKEGFICE